MVSAFRIYLKRVQGSMSLDRYVDISKGSIVLSHAGTELTASTHKVDNIIPT